MNILIVGNGFDLAHGLATSYQNCLDFFTIARHCIDDKYYDEYRSILWRDPSRVSSLLKPYSYAQIDFLKDILEQKKRTKSEEYTLFCDCIKNNFWIDHFLSKQYMNEDGQHKWIDFEAEILRVIKSTDQIVKKMCVDFTTIERLDTNFFSDQDIKRFPYLGETGKNITSFLRKKFSPNSIIEHVYPSIIELFYEDLRKLTTAIEIYIKTCTITEPEFLLDDMHDIGNIDKVVSFNYTDTFLYYMLHNETPREDVCYIHGTFRDKIQDENSPIVLGINEYLDNEKDNQDVDWIVFRKSFQRIFKHTDCQCLDWVTGLSAEKNANNEPNNLYIWGHSLDITDGDILRELIDQPNQTTTIFYRNEKQLSSEIINLIKILGIDNLNKHTRKTHPTILFKKQKGPFFCI